MDSETIKIPVEYTIITTSDWTKFEIVEGGWWQDLKVECKAGADKLKEEITADKKSIHIGKESNDETLVVAHAKAILNIKKEFKQSDIKYKITKGDLQSTIVMIYANRKMLFPLVNKGSDFWGDHNAKMFSCVSKDYIRDLTKEKVFIIHGHEEIQALRLKDFLNKKNVKAFTLEDLTHKGKTIFEQIEYAQNNFSYAIAILTPDDVGCLKSNIDLIAGLKSPVKEKFAKISEELKGRTRQNVLFELGLFIGALGKENICYLKQKDLEEIFSDFHGVLYFEFDKNIDQTFPKLQEELFSAE